MNPAATTTAVVGAPNPSVFGEQVTFTATVTVTPPGAGTPAGSVTFRDGATMLGTVPLSGNQATLMTALAVGPHAITAEYLGNASFAGSTSPIFTQTVNPAATTTAVVGAPNPSVFGEQVTFTATVTVTPPGAGTPAGLVTFRDGATGLGTVMLIGGQATLMTSTLAVGLRSITAEYLGSPSFTGSMSPIFTQTVNQAATTTGTGLVAQSVGVRAVGDIHGDGDRRGARRRDAGRDGGVFQAGAVLGRDRCPGRRGATFATSLLAVGSHSITAVYWGAASHATSTSGGVVQVVQIVANPDAYNATGNIAITVAGATGCSATTATGASG